MDSNPTETAGSAASIDVQPRLFPTAVALTLVARLIMLSASLGSSIIVARWLGAQGLGSLAVINVTVALAVQLGCAGLPSANGYFISQDRRNLERVWSNSLLFAIIAGVAIVGAILIVATFRPSLFGSVPRSLITIAAFSIPFQLITLIGLNVFLALGQIERFNIIDASANLALLLNAMVAVVLLGTGLFVLIPMNIATWIVLGLVIALMIRHSVKKTAEKISWFDSEMFSRMIRYGLKFHICVVAAIFIVRADLLMVNKFRGSTEAGVYAVAGQMANLLMLLPGIVATLLFPRVAAESDPRAHLTMRVTRHIAFVMFFVCLAAVPLAFALPLIYGPSFATSTYQLLILLPGVYLFGIESVLVQHFTGTGLPGTIPIFWVITLVVNLVSNLLLIPTYGATAAAVVSSFTYALIFVLVAMYFRAKTGNHLASALVLRRDEAQQLFRPRKFGLFSS